MALNAIYKTKDEFEAAVEDSFRSLYSERNGQWELTGITGIKTQADVDRIQNSLNTERVDHKKTKDRLRAVHFKGKSVVEMNDDELRGAVEALDRYDELEASAGKVDDEKLNQIVESRIKTKLAPVERERDGLKTQLAEATEKVTSFEQRERQRTIHDAVRKAATAAKLRDTAYDDALLLAERVFDVDESGNVVVRDQVGFTPGVAPDVWLTELQDKRPHWWPESKGGGARGGQGGGQFANNPFSADGWNLTEQGKLVRENPQRADQMAKAAGTAVGGPRPQKK